jgi:hypothetical protein
MKKNRPITVELQRRIIEAHNEVMRMAKKGGKITLKNGASFHLSNSLRKSDIYSMVAHQSGLNLSERTIKRYIDNEYKIRHDS